MNVTKTKLLILIKPSIACSCVSHKLLMYPIEDNCCDNDVYPLPGAWNKLKELPKIMN